LAAIVFVALPLAAQQSSVPQSAVPQSGSVSGTIVEKTAPVRYANVLIFTAPNGKFAKGALTDSLGAFTIPNLALGTYSLRVRRIGFKERRMDITLSAAMPSLNLRTITLQNDETVLEGVEVTADKDVIKKTTQGFILNADATLSQQGGTATDVLRNMPTVAVDAEGSVSIRGKAPLILINGRNSSVTNLDNIPASSIESVEIINNPSSQYDADAEAGIINIRLKKGGLDGINVAAALGLGYGAKGRVNSSVLINYKTDAVNIGLAYDNRFAGRIRNVNGDRTNTALPDEYYLTQRRSDDRLETNHNLRFNLDYAMNTTNTLTLELIGALSGQDNDETLLNTIETQARALFAKYSRRSIELARNAVGEVAAGYKRTFETKGQQLSINLSSSFNNERENTDITNQNLSASGANDGAPFLQRTHNYQFTNVTTFKADYAQPLADKGTFETGYKAIVRYLTTDFQSLDNVGGAYIVKPYASSLFDFREQIHALYAQYGMTLGENNNNAPHWKIDVGLRGEYVANAGNSQENTFAFNRTYWNIFPTASVAYFLAPGEFLKLNYSRRINRPGLGQLNPFTDVTDSLNQRSGNPDLKPELVHALEAGYSRDWEALSLSASLFFRSATDVIRPFTVLRSDGVAFSKPMNFGNATTYGVETIMSIYPTKSWTINASLSLFQQNIDGSNVQQDVANSALSWYAKVVSTSALWENANLQLIGNYNAPTPTPQGFRLAIYNVDVALQQKVLDGKGRIGLIVTDVFNTQYNGFVTSGDTFTFNRTAKVDTRALQVTFAYTFGATFKEKLMENTFSND
jgi:outer membrane receptor protein involved in Fe transport